MSPAAVAILARARRCRPSGGGRLLPLFPPSHPSGLDTACPDTACPWDTACPACCRGSRSLLRAREFVAPPACLLHAVGCAGGPRFARPAPARFALAATSVVCKARLRPAARRRGARSRRRVRAGDDQPAKKRSVVAHAYPAAHATCHAVHGGACHVGPGPPSPPGGSGGRESPPRGRHVWCMHGTCCVDMSCPRRPWPCWPELAGAGPRGGKTPSSFLGLPAAAARPNSLSCLRPVP